MNNAKAFIGHAILPSTQILGVAVNIAQMFGVSELIIGLTIIAIGHLPELATVGSIEGPSGDRDWQCSRLQHS